MINWRKRLGKEARSLFVLAPLLAVAVILAAEAAKSQAAERLSQSPLSPLSPLASATAQSGVTVLGLQGGVWGLGFGGLVAIALVGAVLYVRGRRNG